MSHRNWLCLSLTEGIGPILARRLVEATGSAEAACHASANVLKTIEGIGSARAPKLAQALVEARAKVEDEMARAHAMPDVGFVCPDDEAFPYLLRAVPDAPLILYIRGTLEPRDLNSIAIVGSRKCSFYGREQSERFGAMLAGAGFTVISGGARGIDSAAHRGAMQQPNGRTIAVLGSGIDVSYPPENAELFNQIAARGCVLSEYPMGTPPLKDNFPKRNRVVSGMSRGVLVIEADERSGALITARQAIEDHQRPVMAIPGRVDNALSAGPHKLIREGATLVTRVEHILEAVGALDASLPEMPLFESPAERLNLPVTPATLQAVSVTTLLSADQRHIHSALTRDPLGVDAIVEQTSLAAHVVLRELTMLTLKGFAKRVDGQRFVRTG